MVDSVVFGACVIVYLCVGLQVELICGEVADLVASAFKLEGLVAVVFGFACYLEGYAECVGVYFSFLIASAMVGSLTSSLAKGRPNCARA